MSKSNAVNLEGYSQEAKTNIENRVFRVFISSTFDDMQGERNQLVQDVFPRIRKLCKERAVKFDSVELRWGITANQKERGEAIGICLNNIQLSRPFFIGLVGERYGWIPQTSDICKGDFEKFQFLKKDVDNELSATEIEFQFAVLRETTEMKARFWLRSDKMETPPQYREKNPESIPKLEQFKKELRNQKKCPVAEYDSLEDLGRQVEKVLTQWLDDYFPKMEKYSWLDKQNDDQGAFEDYLSRSYVENIVEYDKLNAFVESTEQTQAVVGASGLGKSALLANWKSVCAKKFPDVKVITHYVAASKNSDLPANILRRLTESLDPNITTENEVSLDLKSEQKTLDDFFNEFATMIAQYLADNPGKRLLFVIDGLNQLSDLDDTKELRWLPPLPKRAQYLLSTVPNDHSFETIKQRGWNVYSIKELDEKQREEIVQKILTDSGRCLTPNQLKKILSFSLASNPLVLKTLLDELFVFGVYPKFDEEIDRYVDAKSVDDFFDKVFERLESNEQFIETNLEKRKEIVKKLALLLAVSRFGLTENELGTVSEYDQLSVSTFLCVLDPQLVNRSGRYSFAHDFIRQAVLKRYDEKIDAARRLLIDKFLELKPDEERRLQEVPFQYLQLESWEELRCFLLDFDVFNKLYKGTFNCDFCTYWNAASRNGREEFRFDSYLELNPNKPFQWFNLAHIAKAYNEFSTSEKAYQKALTLYSQLVKENSKANKPYVARILNNLAILHSDTDRLDDAEKEFQEALALYRQLAKENPQIYKPDVANTLNNWARLHKKTNRLDNAEKEYKEALVLYRQLAEENPIIYKPSVARTLNNLAILHSDTDRLYDAEKEFQEALALCLQLAKENPKTYKSNVAMTLNNWAILHSNTDRLDDAEKEYKEALALYRQLAEENPKVYKPFVAMTLNNLAILHSDTDRLDNVEQEFQEALEIRRSLEQENPKMYRFEIAMTLNNLAVLHSKRNRLDKAKKEYMEALALCRQLVEENPKAYEPYVAKILINWANYHSESNRLDEAKQEYQEVLVLFRQLAEENPKAYKSDVAMSLNNLAMFHKKTSRLDDAENEYQETLVLYRQLAEENPKAYKPDVVKSLNNLAALHSDMNRLDDAENEFQETLVLCRQLVEENPKTYTPSVAKSLNNLAMFHKKTNRLDDAKNEYQEALVLYRQLAEENPKTYKPDVAKSLNNLAALHSDMNRLDDAENKYQEALKLYRQLTGENPKVHKPDVAMTLFYLANLHFNTNRLDDAEKEYKEALSLCRQLEDEDSNVYKSNLAGTLNNLAGLHSYMNRLDVAEKEFQEALEIRRLLAEESPNVYKPFVAETLYNMTSFYHEMGKADVAMDFISEAITIYEEFAEISPVCKERLEIARSLKEEIQDKR